MYIFCICCLKIQSIDCFWVCKDFKTFFKLQRLFIFIFLAKSKKDEIIEYCYTVIIFSSHDSSSVEYVPVNYCNTFKIDTIYTQIFWHDNNILCHSFITWRCSRNWFYVLWSHVTLTVQIKVLCQIFLIELVILLFFVKPDKLI